MTNSPCEGYTFYSAAGPGGNPTLIDMDGQVVHKWSIPASWPKYLAGGSILGAKRMRAEVDKRLTPPPPPPGIPAHQGIAPDGPPHGRPNFDSIEFVQESWDGREEWSFTDWDDDGIGVMMSRAHHDSEREGNPVGYYAPGQDYLPHGKTLILSRKTRNDPAISRHPLADDCIYEVDWAGNLTGFTWFCSDHVDEVGFDAAAREAIVKGATSEIDPVGFDWMHINTISVLGRNRWYDQSRDDRFDPKNIMISSRNANFIAIVSRATGRLVWKAGPDFLPGTPEFALGQFVGQHHPHIVPMGLPGAGNVLVFDNGGQSGYGGPDGYPRYRRDYSRVIEFNPVTFEVVWLYESDSGTDKFFSQNISSAQRLPNGNTLVDEGAKGHIFEVAPDKRIVWEYTAPATPPRRSPLYRAYRIPPEWVPGNPAGYTPWSESYPVEQR